MGIFSTLFDENERNVRKLKKIADKVEELSERFKAMSDEELQAITPALKERYNNGEKLDALLPEAFAAVREASTRVTGLRHYYVQLLGGITLHQGRIAEMKTGEGKTLVETLPAYLNALTGNGVHVVTVNDYLAKRDAEWMGKIYRFLGMSVGVILHDMKTEDKKAAYNADITYGTNNEFGFDYLRDNMAVTKEDRVQRGHAFAIVDEVDSILIDEARTPLIISGRGDKSSDMYIRANRFARTLKEGEDYTHEEKEKTVNLTDEGVAKAEKFFGVQNLTDLDNTALNHYINQAMKANVIMKKDVDYIVQDGQVLIVDEFTGRVMTGRRFSDGLHQAIEAKENVRVQSENRTLATITLQNYFRLYKKLSGMTGTAKTEEEEFQNIYNLDVVVIPTNLPMIRIDENDQIYTKKSGKIDAIIKDIKDCAERRQPVLVGTVSVEKSELLSKILHRERIFHNVLNAKNHKMEADIVAQAGRIGAVTIATNMAGRGTDIMLGGNPEYLAKQRLEKEGYGTEDIETATSFVKLDDENLIKLRDEYQRYYKSYKETCDKEKEEVIEAGGLRIIGTERHESRRVDRQLRGRAGRQGDPGSSVFFVSLEDNLMRLFASERIARVMDKLGFKEGEMIEAKMINNSIERAQKKVEENNFGIRKRLLEYDDVMNKQRTVIYEKRRHALMGQRIGMDIANMVWDRVINIIENCPDYAECGKQFIEIFAMEAPFTEREYDNTKREDLYEMAFQAAMGNFKRKTDRLAEVARPVIAQVYENQGQMYENILVPVSDGKFVYSIQSNLKEAYENDCRNIVRDFEKTILLRHIDEAWKENLRELDDLKKSVQNASYEQKDPLLVFKLESVQLFDKMVNRINNATVSSLMRAQIPVQAPEEVREAAPEQPTKQPKYTESHETVEEQASREAAGRDTRERQQQPIVKEKLPGRNDPCPCGSGKKFKNCHGRGL